MSKLKLQFLLSALTNLLFIANLHAEPKISIMPSTNPITSKVVIPAIKTGEQHIPVLPKDVSGNKDKAYVGANLAIINNQESNKPLPIKKKMPLNKKANLESKHIIDSKQSSGGLKVIEHGKISTENFNDNSNSLALPTNASNKNLPDTGSNINKDEDKNIVENKASNIKLKENKYNKKNIPTTMMVTTQNSKINDKELISTDIKDSSRQNLSNTSNLSILQLKEEIDSLHKEIKQLKIYLKIKD